VHDLPLGGFEVVAKKASLFLVTEVIAFTEKIGRNQHRAQKGRARQSVEKVR
jgi:hypothetical protein